MLKKYAKIEKDIIAKFKTISDKDDIIIPKLLAHDYRIVEEMPVPTHDYITQSVTESYEIQKDKVLRVWTIKDRSFEEAKRMKQETIENEALDDIKLSFESGTEQKDEIDKILINKDAAIVKIETAKNNTELRKIKYKEAMR